MNPERTTTCRSLRLAWLEAEQCVHSFSIYNLPRTNRSRIRLSHGNCVKEAIKHRGDKRNDLHGLPGRKGALRPAVPLWSLHAVEQKMHTPWPLSERQVANGTSSCTADATSKQEKNDESTDVWQENLSQNNRKSQSLHEGANGSLWSALPHSNTNLQSSAA